MGTYFLQQIVIFGLFYYAELLCVAGYSSIGFENVPKC